MSQLTHCGGGEWRRVLPCFPRLACGTGGGLLEDIGHPAGDAHVVVHVQIAVNEELKPEIIPFQVKMGMVVLGSFVGEEDTSVYVWIRRFESEAERKRLYDAVYQSDYWKNEIAPRVPQMIDREQIKVTRIIATPHSVIQ